MSDFTRPQTWQIVNENPLDVLETQERQPLDIFSDILDTKLNFPFRLSLSGSVLTIHESEIQTIKANGLGGTVNSFKIGTSPVESSYLKVELRDLDLSTGSVTGSGYSDTLISPSTLSNNFVWLGLQIKTGTGVLEGVWGVQGTSAALATYPTFTSPLAVCLILLHNNGTTGLWQFLAPNPEDIIIFKAGGGGGSGGTNDFVPLFKSSTQYRLANTRGKSSRFNEKYFYTNTDLDFSYNLSLSNQLYYICIDTDQEQGEITDLNKLTYIKETTLDPKNPSFPENLVVLGYYEVVGGIVTQQNVGSSTSREIDTFIGDLTSSFNSYTSYRVQNTYGRKVRLNNRYYYLNNDLVKTVSPTPTSGTWYFCIDTETSLSDGELTLAHLKETQLDPSDIYFPQNYCVVGSAVASASGFGQSTFNVNSAREMNSLLNDFSPSFISWASTTLTYNIQSTNGKKSKILSSYFWSTQTIVKTFTPTASGKYFICLNSEYVAISDQGNIGAVVDSPYIIIDVIDPSTDQFPPYYISLGEFIVTGTPGNFNVSENSFIPYNYAMAGQTIFREHFVPIYLDQTKFTIRSTFGRLVLVNGKYYSTNKELYVPWDTSNGDGKYYICLDTSNPSGVIPIDASGNQIGDFFVMTTNPPNTNNYNPYYAALGEYIVSGGSIVTSSALAYSTREIISWVYGLPNMKKKTDMKNSTNSPGIAPGSIFTLSYDWNIAPDIITYKYWDNSLAQFTYIDRIDAEISLTSNSVTYKIPTYTPPLNFADIEDYFEVEILTYAYSVEGGFASPKTDFTSDWYQSNLAVPSLMPHNLMDRPKNITIEYQNSILGPGLETYWVEDGNQYINKNTGYGVGIDYVNFDWTTLPILSSTLKMRVHLNLSKLSAGSFVATVDTAGIAKVTGLTYTAISPDLVLKSTDTNFAPMISNNMRVLVVDNITVTSSQNITATGVSFDMLPGKYIVCSTPVNYVLGFSGEDYEVENARIISQEDITQGLQLSTSGIVKNVTVKQNATAKTLLTGVRVVPKTSVLASHSTIQEGILNIQDEIQGLEFLPAIASVHATITGGVLGSVNEVQSFNFSTVPTQGSYTLTLNLLTTPSLPYYSIAATIQAALIALNPGLYTGKITVSGNYIKGFTITFDNSLGDVPQMTSSLTGLKNVSSPTEGTYTLTLGVDTSGVLNYNATSLEIQSALESLPGVGLGRVVVSGNYTIGFTITFDKILGNVVQLTSALNNLNVGGTATVIGRVKVVKGIIEDSFLDTDENSEIIISDNF